MKIGRQFEKRKEKFKRKMGTLDKSKSISEKFSKNQQERDQSKRGAPRQRTVGALYQFVSPGDLTGTDRAGVYRARVEVNVAANEKKHENEYQQYVR